MCACVRVRVSIANDDDTKEEMLRKIQIETKKCVQRIRK